MRYSVACLCIFCLPGPSFGQTAPVKSSKPAHTAAIASVPVAKEIEPVILTRAALDDKIVTLRVAARIATSIRLPEPVNSVVVGDP